MGGDAFKQFLLRKSISNGEYFERALHNWWTQEWQVFSQKGDSPRKEKVGFNSLTVL